MNKLLSWGIVCLFISVHFFNFSQNIKTVKFSQTELKKETANFLGTPQIEATDYKVFQMNIEELKNQLEGIMHREDSST